MAAEAVNVNKDVQTNDTATPSPTLPRATLTTLENSENKGVPLSTSWTFWVDKYCEKETHLGLMICTLALYYRPLDSGWIQLTRSIIFLMLLFCEFGK